MNRHRLRAGVMGGTLVALLLVTISANGAPGTPHSAQAPSGLARADSRGGGPPLPLPAHFTPPRYESASPAQAAGIQNPAPGPKQAVVDNGTWFIVSPGGPLPPTPDQHVGVFDTQHNQMVVYGGFGLVTDTWSLDLAGMIWSQVAASNPPSQRWGANAIYDPIADRLVMFGGYTEGRYADDLMILPLDGSPAWTQVPRANPWPPARLFGSGIYDPVRYRMIVFGGEAGPSFNDVWALNLSSMTWTQIVPAGAAPTERYGHSAVYDPAGDQMIMYGDASDDVWSLSLGGTPTWTQLHPAGGSPGGRVYHTLVMDTQQERVILHGGFAGDGALSDTWQLTLGPNPVWTQLSPGGPAAPPRRLHNALYDPATHRMVVFGGQGTGDLRVLNFTGGPAPPVIYSLEPSVGFEGDTVTIHGVSLADPSSVQFNGVAASIVSSSYYSIVTIVPIGASSGRVTVGTASGPVVSPNNFTVAHAPVFTSVDPTSATIGATVHIYGRYLTDVSHVSFGTGNSFAAITVISDEHITARLDPNAITGPITIVSPFGTASSTSNFVVVHHVPVINSFAPIKGVVGTLVTIDGQYLGGAIRVAFGSSSFAQFTAVSDLQLQATVDGSAVSGPITVTNFDGSTISASSFEVVPPALAPTLVAVLDAPNDQGGKVILEWLASDLDIGLSHSVSKYRIWRRAPLFGAHAKPALGVPVASAATGTAVSPSATSGFLGAALPLDGSPAGFWESIGEVAAARIPGYAFTALTLQDSLPDSNPYTAFIVQSVTGDPSQLYFSDPDSGYSVDNLPPPIPTPFSATYGSSVTRLHWAPSHAPDFAEFRLYRGASADFDPGTGNLLVATNDTSFVDVESNSFYKLAAIDLHGNHSKYAVVSPSQPVAVLAALTFVDSQPDRIRLTWYAAGEPNLSATLYRRTPGTEWTRVTMLTSNAGGLLQYEDRAVVEGGLYGYRLGIMDAGVEVFAGEVWATASRPALALEGILPNPAVGGRFSVAFALPTNESARLEVMDITGRRVATREVGSLGPGRHQLSLGGGEHLPPGVYLVHLVQAQTSRTARVVVIE